MPNKNLIITAPRIGISPSPHTGYADCRNLDIDSIPGVVKLNNILEKKSGSTITGQIKWFVRHPVTTGEIYALDNAGEIYKSADSGATWAVLGGNTFTVTIASPAVFSDTAHGLLENDTVVFSTTGALPTGLTAGTTYYVISAGLTADAFEVSTSQGGAAVNTSGSQSGTHSMLAKTGNNGNGLWIWKNYLFVARNGYLDVCGDGTATGIVANAWTFNWKAIDSDVLWHPILHSKNDDKLYGGAGRFVFSIEEETTFNPATPATYTFTAQALDLPASYRIKCIEELGNNLMLGTWQGTNVYDIRIADIFPWDRSSSSFGQPIVLSEYGIHAMKNLGNSLIVLAGIAGTIYRCDGVSAYIIGQLPIDLSGGKYIEYYPNALTYYKQKIFFGVGHTGLTVGEVATTFGGMGVYSLKQTGRGNILNYEHFSSAETDGSAASVKYSALLPISDETLLLGWRSNTTYGIDLTNSASYAYTTDYSGYFDSPFYIVGDYHNKRTFTELSFQLAKELATGEGIKFEYRVNLTDNFTAIKGVNNTTLTLTYAILGAVDSHSLICDIPACEMLQIRVSLLGSSTTTNQFRQLIIR